MEAKFSSPPRSNGGATQAAGGASKHLVDLPSRGLFSSPVLSSTPGTMRVYVCERETAPPAHTSLVLAMLSVVTLTSRVDLCYVEDQLIKTNTTNILIRALQINKQKSELKDVTAKSSTDGCNGKRSVRTTEGRAPPKKIKGKRALTKREKGKDLDELIARLKDEL
ncbi:hypothetical protein ZIOFF_020275 [Zingiber officinale]|uniref:DET1- and DDB1-associated protein 1 n=1 Tax=Zingiber officinale TaxID=94328 RepID=A0A8J5H637_ZINOF|nr:hypothetical protein ZIOFF_020275 [Zingiber officinale]